MTESTLTRNDFQRAVQLINGATSCLVTTHTKPDGDACGCCVALAESLAAQGKHVKTLLLSPMPEWYAFLFSQRPPVLGQDITVEQLVEASFGPFDLIVIVDTNSFSQLPQFDSYLKKTAVPILVIDHHATGDNLGSVQLVDLSAAAASCIVLDLLRFAKWPISARTAQALFTGIATDTGWFHFSNTDTRSLRDCAELIDKGADPALAYRNIYQNFSAARFKLMAITLNSLELHFDGRYAVQYLTRQDFKQTGAKYEDTENLIDECQRIASVEVSALFVEMKDNRIRCSLRSRGPVDVAKIAAKFSGGGHPNAAGAYLPGPLEHAKSLIFAELRSRLA